MVVRPAPIVPVYANTRVSHTPPGFEPYFGETVGWVEVLITYPTVREQCWWVKADYVVEDEWT